MAYRDVILADSPSAYWRLNEPSGTTAVDLVGAKNGTISGGVTLNQPGALADGDKAMAFNGAALPKIMTAAPYTRPAIATIEAWAKTTNSPGAYRAILSYRNPYTGAGEVMCGVSAASHAFIGANVNLDGIRLVNDGNWHHFVFIITGSSASIYVDGVLDTTGPLALTAATAKPITIGCDDNGSNAWDGSVDEVAIYPVALTPAQILAHYQARALPYLPGTYPYQVVQDGASNYWRLNEPSGVTAVDVLGAANGTISGGVTLAQPGALADGDKAMLFNGTTGVVTTTPPTITLPATIEAWVKRTGPSSYAAAFSCRGVPNGFLFGLGVSGTDVVCYSDNSTPSEVGAGVTLTLGQWYHIVFVRNPSACVIYVNGTAFPVTQSHAAVVPVSVRLSDPGNGNAFNGLIDDVAIYPVALTPAQIAAHFSAGQAGPSWAGIPWWVQIGSEVLLGSL